MAKLLIESGANIDEYIINSDMTEEMINPDMTEEIIESTALQYATLNNFVDMVRLLISSGADVNKVDGDNKTALEIACECFPHDGHGEIVNMLCDAGANMDIQVTMLHWDPDNDTVFHLTCLDSAIFECKPAVVRALLEHNAPFAKGWPRTADDIMTHDAAIITLVMEHVVNREKCVAFAMCQVDRLKNFDETRPKIPYMDPELMAMVIKMTF